MSQHAVRRPPPLCGILGAHEIRKKVFGPLPKGYTPLLQNYPGNNVRVLEQGVDFITIENLDPTMSPFMVLFLNQRNLQALHGVKQIVDAISKKRR